MKAIRDSDVVIVCLSRGSITKEGYVQKEIKDALDVADEKPEGTIFLIPLRLEDCDVPERLRRWHYANLYEEKGYDRLRKALQRRAHTLGITGEPSPAPQQQSVSPQVVPPGVAPGTPPVRATVIEQRSQKDSEIPVDQQIWDDLMSNDPIRIEAAAGRIEDRQKRGYINRLLSIISDQKTNDLTTRIAAGNVLGMLGDPRLVEMISIPSGTFKMGTDRGDDESPQREIYLDTFEIAKYPLTNVQYKTFLDTNPDH